MQFVKLNRAMKVPSLQALRSTVQNTIIFMYLRPEMVQCFQKGSDHDDIAAAYQTAMSSVQYCWFLRQLYSLEIVNTVKLLVLFSLKTKMIFYYRVECLAVLKVDGCDILPKTCPVYIRFRANFKLTKSTAVLFAIKPNICCKNILRLPPQKINEWIRRRCTLGKITVVKSVYYHHALKRRQRYQLQFPNS